MTQKNINNIRICPVSRKCGGCQLMNMTYEEQLRYKQAKVVKLLSGFHRVNSIIGMETPFHYRNKVQAAFGRTRSGEIISGVYQSSTHNIVKTDSCLIEDKKADEIILTIRKLVKSFKLTVYDEKNERGFLRHVLVKRGFTTNEIMVVLVTGTSVFPSKNAFVKELLKLHPDITTIVQNINNKFTSMVLGDKETVLYGKGYIEDILCGCRFRISPKSFYQINPVQTEILYGKAVEFAGLTGKERVIDAYCGIGTIGIVASKSAGEVIGVEVNPDAVRDAKVNAKINDIENISFYCADAGEFMVSMKEQGEKCDVLFMDPPRAGSDKKFLSCAVSLAPERIVYISCNPETQQRDLYFLTKNGYKVKRIQPVDMFPYTNHVESVVCLSKGKADDCKKETKMISEEKSVYKSWSNLKKQMNDLLCDSLKGKISYFYTSYHEVHNAYGRATIQYEKKEIVAFSWDRQYEQVQDIKEQYRKMDNVPSMLVDYEGSLNAYKVANITATKEKWMPNCTLCETDFIHSLTIYLKTDITTSLHSDNYLLRVFAYMDRRVGKRTLIKIKDDVEKLPDWVKQFYQIRCEADSIIFPPKRITDETVVLLKKS